MAVVGRGGPRRARLLLVLPPGRPPEPGEPPEPERGHHRGARARRSARLTAPGGSARVTGSSSATGCRSSSPGTPSRRRQWAAPSASTGTMTIAGGQVTAVTIEADLTRLQSDQDRRDEYLRTSGLETDDHPHGHVHADRADRPADRPPRRAAVPGHRRGRSHPARRHQARGAAVAGPVGRQGDRRRRRRHHRAGRLRDRRRRRTRITSVADSGELELQVTFTRATPTSTSAPPRPTPT